MPLQRQRSQFQDSYFTIAEVLTRQSAEEHAMADDRDQLLRPIPQPAPEFLDPTLEDGSGLADESPWVQLTLVVPPNLVQVVESEMRELLAEQRRGPPHIAAALQVLPGEAFDMDR